MTAQVYSVHGQTEGRRKAFLEWKSIDLSYKLLHGGERGGSNVNYYKSESVHHLILLVGIRNILPIFKINQ